LPLNFGTYLLTYTASDRRIREPKCQPYVFMFGDINSSTDIRTDRNNCGRTAGVHNISKTLYKQCDVTNRTPLSVYRGPCHFFRPSSISSRRTITKPCTNSVTSRTGPHCQYIEGPVTSSDQAQLVAAGP